MRTSRHHYPYDLDEVDPDGFGECDTCDVAYVLADAEDHCTECGNCNEHCVCSPTTNRQGDLA